MGSLLKKSLEQVPKETRHLASKLFDITDEILDIMERLGLSQKELAERLGKKESEISKWMKGTHNFTEETIVKIEIALGEPITVTLKQAREKYAALEEKLAKREKKLKERQKMLEHWEQLLKEQENAQAERTWITNAPRYGSVFADRLRNSSETWTHLKVAADALDYVIQIRRTLECDVTTLISPSRHVGTWPVDPVQAVVHAKKNIFLYHKYEIANEKKIKVKLDIDP